jgi:hypothetical protein
MGDRNTSLFLILSASMMLAGLSSGTELAFGQIVCNESHFDFRTFNGTCNNLDNSEWGSAGSELLRKSQTDYGSNNSLAGLDRESPRLISNIVASQGDDIIFNQHHASDFIWQWGQFLDHDIDLTPSAYPPDPKPIPIPFGDGTFVEDIRFNRSMHNNNDTSREQINIITAFIDASNVYGSDSTTASMLRIPDSYLLNTTNRGDLGDLLPEVTTPMGTMFLAGDERANEQIGLTAMHTLFVREHNRIADEIYQKHPELRDDNEAIFQIARKVVGAEMQVITYNEFLPKLLGPNALPKYSGYKDDVNPGIKNEFSTASYRYGHSQLSPSLLIINDNGKNPVPLKEAFFNSTKFKEVGGVDAILLGMSHQKAQEIDNLVVDDVRNFLFENVDGVGFDLASLNIQRGRDHGLADYNTVRVAYGLERVESFEEISSNPDVQAKLKEAYRDNYDNIDLWVGGLAEDHVPNAMVGETIRAVLIDQFTSLRDGDRFWYQNDPFFQDNRSHMKEVEKTTLADIIKSNTEISDIHHDVFHYKHWKEI